MSYLLRIPKGDDFTRAFTWVAQRECGIVGDANYKPKLLFDLSGSSVTFRAWLGSSFSLEIPNLASETREESPGVDKLAASILTLTAAQTNLFPTASDAKFEFIRWLAGSRTRLFYGTVRAETP